ncbi:P-loop NTPase fold protein [Patescibacteria group bacterium]
MTIEKTLKQIENKLEEWGKNKEKLVVGIDGYSGVGKSTILLELARKMPDVIVVDMDNFVFTAKKSVDTEITTECKNPKDINHQWNNLEKLCELRHLVNNFKTAKTGNTEATLFSEKTNKYDLETRFDFSKNILVIAGVFLQHPFVLDDLIDKQIYLDANLAQVDKRRVVREKKRWGDQYMSEDHPDSFFGMFKRSFVKYTELYNPKEKADLIIEV